MKLQPVRPRSAARISATLHTGFLSFAFALALAALFSVSTARAQSTWQVTSGQWGIGSNWSSGTAPDMQDAAVLFDNTVFAANRTVTVNGAYTAGSLLLRGMGGTTTTTFNSGTLNFDSTEAGGAIFRVQDQNHVTVGSAVSLGSHLSLIADFGSASGFSNAFTINGAILGNGHILDAVASNPASTITLAGVISGAGTRLVKSGGGALSLTGYNNTFDGGLEIYNGRVNTAIRAGAGSGIVIGAEEAGANNLGAGGILVANNGTVLAVNSSGTGQFAELRSGTLAVLADIFGAGRFQLTEASTAHNGLAFRMTGGELTGLGGVAAGSLYLTAADFDYHAGLITGAPNLVLDTQTAINAANAITVNLNGAALDGSFGTVSKLGHNQLTFNGGGVFRAENLFITSGSGALNLGATTFDLANGLTLGGTNVAFTNLRTGGTAAGWVNLGVANQLGNSALNAGSGAIGNVYLNGSDQIVNDINLAPGARLGLWFNGGAPATLTVNNLTADGGPAAPTGANYLSIYNWTGNPATHLGDGTLAANGNTVIAGPGADLDKIWFRGYAPGAVDIGGGVLAPTDFLHTTYSGADAGNWFDLANWSVDVPDGAGTVVTIDSSGNKSLQNQTVTVGHLVVSGSNTPVLTSGTLVFDSGVTGVASTISGTRGIQISNALTLNNDLIVANTGITSKANVYLSGALSGGGNLVIGGSNSMRIYGAIANYTGNIDLSGTLIFGTDGGTTISKQFTHSGTVFVRDGARLTIDEYDLFGLHASAALGSALVIDGNFALYGVMVNYAGDVALTVSHTIAIGGYSNDPNAERRAGFSGSTNLVGAGGLTVADGNSAFLLSDGNTFSGGLVKIGSGALYTELHSDLVTGTLSAGHNYLGLSDIAINSNASIIVNNNGYDAYLRGVTSATTNGNYQFIGSGSTIISGTMNLASNSYVTFNGGDGLITDSAEWNTTAGNSRINFDHNLTVNAPFLGNAVDLYARPGFGQTYALTSTMADGIANVGTLTKENQGTLVLSSTLHSSGLNMFGGVFVLNGSEFIQPRSGVVPATSVVMNAGSLYAKGGAAGSPWFNRYNNLSITGNAGFYLENHSALYFNNLIAWSAVSGTNYYTLNLANDSGLWSTAGDPAAYDTYVYFTSTTGFGGASAVRLNYVAFTGYERGAELVQVSGSNVWFLAPSGAQLSEWVGAKDTGVDTDRLWSNAANWVGGVPDAAGRVAAVRDVDGLLNGNTVMLDADATVGKLSLESGNAQIFTIDGANGRALTFDNNGARAVLDNSGNHRATISAGLHLASDLDVFTTTADALYLNGAISGSGGIWFGSIGILGFGGASGASDYTGGFHLVGSTATSGGGARPHVIIATNGSIFGSGSYNGTDAAGSLQPLTVGDGTPNRWYSMRSDVGDGAYVIDAAVRIAGNLYFDSAGPYPKYATLTFRSADPGYIASGTWSLQGTRGAFELRHNVIVLDQDLQGETDSALIIENNASVRFLGDNSFGGGVIVKGNVGIGSDTALGTGLVQVESGAQFFALGGTRTISNDILFNAGAYWGDGNFILAYNGTSTMQQLTGFSIGNQGEGRVVTVNAGHVLTGPGGLRVNEGMLILLGSNAYTGNTILGYRGRLAVGDDHALGSGTLVFDDTTVLSSHGGPVTLANPVEFYRHIAYLDGSAGLLTLDPAAGAIMGTSPNLTIRATGSVGFGSNLAISGTVNVTKEGAGTLILASGSSDYSGTTTLTQGTLRVNAGGDITLGRAAAGENYLGTGGVRANGTVRLELVTGDGNAVHLGGNLDLNGYYDNQTGELRITDAADVVSGTNIKVYLDPVVSATLGGNTFGHLRAPGDIIKTGTGTLTWTGGNIVTGAGKSFIMEEGVLNWSNNLAQLTAGGLEVQSGTVNIGATMTQNGIQRITLGDGAVLNLAGHTFTGTNIILALAGSATIDLGDTGRLTLGGIDGGAWNGSLAVAGWAGDPASGNGTTQVRFTQDVLAALTPAQLAAVRFFSNTPGLGYAAGSRLARNAAGFYELLPMGVTTEWLGGGVGDNWSVSANWQNNVPPNGAGSIAIFGDLDPTLDGAVVPIDVALTLGGFVFNNTAGADFAIDGGFMTLDGGAADAMITLTGDSDVEIKVTDIQLVSDLDIIHDGTGTLTLSGQLTGTDGTASTASLLKSGSGTLVLANANNIFTGGVTLLGGAIETSASTAGAAGSVTAGPLGTGTLTAGADAALVFTAAGAQTINNAL
ncbi:MAG: autotransporter-associated beta strand repeat-containing protein, partial [Opitutaceae bacterium]|nr:autotransporter-associated beta strand repeat-containing protein [Opitutaceae bacterium]